MGWWEACPAFQLPWPHTYFGLTCDAAGTQGHEPAPRTNQRLVRGGRARSWASREWAGAVAAGMGLRSGSEFDAVGERGQVAMWKFAQNGQILSTSSA